MASDSKLPHKQQNIAEMSTKLVPADRIKETEGSIWHEFELLAFQHKPVNLGQGFPDVVPASYVTQAMVDTMRSNSVAVHQYARAYGQNRLVNILAKFFSKLIDRRIEPKTETLITVGASHAFYCAVLGHVNPGDEVILIEPAFNIYSPTVRMAEGIPVFVPLRPKKTGEITSSGDWVLHYEELSSKFNRKTKAIILNNPNNPLGKVYKRNELEMIAELAKKWDVLVISDEVYEWLVFDGNEHIRIATLPGMWERTITVGSAGKTFNVTGWKMGWAYGPSHLIQNCQMIFDNFVNCVAVPIQEAVAICLEKEIERIGQPECYFHETCRELQAKRDFVVNMLLEVGMHPVVPEAGYFTLADYSRIGSKVDFDQGGNKTKDHKFCIWLIKEKKLAAIPPSAFFSSQNKHLVENYIRFSHFKDSNTLEAAKEIVKGLGDL